MKTVRLFPEVTKQEAEGIKKPPSNKTIQVRMTTEEKNDIEEAAEMVNLTLTEYLLKCHAVIAAKLRAR